MIFAKSGSTVVLKPRIRSKTERDWLRGQFKSYIEETILVRESNSVKKFHQKLHILSPMTKQVVAVGIKSYIIKATEEGKNRFFYYSPSIKVSLMGLGKKILMS